MATLEEIKNYRKEALHSAAHKIQTENPESTAVIFAEFDCGCLKVCGVTADGNPTGPFIKMSGLPPKNKEIFICLKCLIDKGPFDRLIVKGILLDKTNTTTQNLKFRQELFHKLFGCDASNLTLNIYN